MRWPRLLHSGYAEAWDAEPVLTRPAMRGYDVAYASAPPEVFPPLSHLVTGSPPHLSLDPRPATLYALDLPLCLFLSRFLCPTLSL